MIPNKVIKVGYWVMNGGDGSAIAHFAQTKEIAETEEEKDSEDYMDGWGEPSAGELKIYIDDKNNFYLRESEFVDGEFIYTFVPLEIEEIEDL